MHPSRIGHHQARRIGSLHEPLEQRRLLSTTGPVASSPPLEMPPATAVIASAPLVLADTPVAPSISGDSNIFVGFAYTLALSPGDLDPGAITAWNVSWGDGTFQPFDGSPAQVSHVYLTPGDYTISATATDDTGDHAASPDLPVIAHAVPTLTGIVFNDYNGDGTRQPVEPGLPGQTVYLDLNGNGVPDEGEPSASTGLSGRYSFDAPVFGTTTLRVDAEGTTFPDGTEPAFQITLESVTAPIDFPLVSRKVIQGAVRGGPAQRVFLDTNLNGRLDAGELSVTSDAHARFAFYDLPAARYRLQPLASAGWRLSTNGVNALVSPTTPVFTHAFAVRPVPRVRGVAFLDANRNGRHDPGERPVARVRIFADLNRDGLRDPGEPIAVTDARGRYAFDTLRPGVYSIRVIPPHGAGVSRGSSGWLIRLRAARTLGGVNFGLFNA